MKSKVYFTKEITEESLIRIYEKLGVELLKPEIKYCTDNASMIGAAAYESFIKNDFTDYKLEPNPSLDL